MDMWDWTLAMGPHSQSETRDHKAVLVTPTKTTMDQSKLLTCQMLLSSNYSKEII